MIDGFRFAAIWEERRSEDAALNERDVEEEAKKDGPVILMVPKGN